MWFEVKLRHPYHHDPDYRDSLVKSIKDALGDVSVDITLLELWGRVDVQVASLQDVSTLSSLPLVGKVRSSVDRGIIPDSSRKFV